MAGSAKSANGVCVRAALRRRGVQIMCRMWQTGQQRTRIHHMRGRESSGSSELREQEVIKEVERASVSCLGSLTRSA